MTYNIYSQFVNMLNDGNHIMIAGTTGSGKSVVLNELIYTILATEPGCGLVLLDPKKVELFDYRKVKQRVLYADEPQSMVNALQWALTTCESRFKRMQRKRLRMYNGNNLYVIIDEYADLRDCNRKEVDAITKRIAQIGRAAKVRLILCTQRVVNNVPPNLRANIISRIGLHTATGKESKEIIEVSGLETLPKYGECIIYNNGDLSRYCVVMRSNEDFKEIIGNNRRKGLFRLI